ncbi:hypothetical protein, partial [uncultured Rikenella sp.]|uniref:hypothetical protein n=1 Tax=uncultured Rikenella sp. TaxID=368003 RepID=UPI0026371891
FFSSRARSSFDPPETALRGRRTANKAKTTLTKRPMGAPAGREMLAHFNCQPLTPFFARAAHAGRKIFIIFVK